MDLDRPNLKNITKHVRRDENVTCFRVGRTDSLVPSCAIELDLE